MRRQLSATLALAATLATGCVEGEAPVDESAEAGEAETGEDCVPSEVELDFDDLVLPYEMPAASLAAPVTTSYFASAIWSEESTVALLPWGAQSELRIEHSSPRYRLREGCGPRVLLVESRMTLSINADIVASRQTVATSNLEHILESWNDLPVFRESVDLTAEFVAQGLEFVATSDGENIAALYLTLDRDEPSGTLFAQHIEELQRTPDGTMSGKVTTQDLADFTLVASTDSDE